MTTTINSDYLTKTKIKPRREKTWKLWTEKEKAYIMRTWPNTQIPGRTQEAIKRKASSMGLAKRDTTDYGAQPFLHLWTAQWRASIPAGPRSVWDLAKDPIPH